MRPQYTSGIYQIVNVFTGECYIGSSRNINTRWQKHRAALRRGAHHNGPLQAAWAEYGERAFAMLVLEYVERTDLFIVEQRYLDAETPTYNLSATAHGGPRIRQHSAESRAKIRAALALRPKTPEHIEKLRTHLRALAVTNRGRRLSDAQRAQISERQRGTKRSPETRAKHSAANRGRPVSETTRQKIGAANRGRSHLVSAEARARIGAAKAEWWRQRKERDGGTDGLAC